MYSTNTERQAESITKERAIVNNINSSFVSFCKSSGIKKLE